MNNNTINIELHCHSNHSDGQETPEQIAKQLHKSNVKYAALTDHDTITGIEQFRQAISRYGIGYVSGVELTTIHNNYLIHILGYGFNQMDKDLLEKLEEFRIKNNSPESLRVEQRITTKEAIKLLQNAGGVAIIAHPLKTEPNFEKLCKIIFELCEYGLNGIEAIYKWDSDDERKKLIDFANMNGLLISSGTDFHSGDENMGMETDRVYWKRFKEEVLKASLTIAEKNKEILLKPPAKSNVKWLSFLLNIILPATLTVILFITALFALLLPYFEQSLLERKRENIRDLTKAALGVLEEASLEADTGQLSLDKAQELAKKRIESMRYGQESKEYFWLQDLTPKILMHPYRKDLNNKDVSEFKDPRNVKIFVEFVNLVKAKNEGFISYVWQWKDNKDRFEAKESYIKLFDKWNWIIGTGIYDKDVKDEIEYLRGHFIKLSLSIVFIVFLLLMYLVKNGLKIEKSRGNAEKLMYESIERYRALTEAATEGALFISSSRCKYANAVMYELLGCNESHLELLEIEDIFPNIEANLAWIECLNNPDEIEPNAVFAGIIKRSDGNFLNCTMTLRYEAFKADSGFMVLIRRNLDNNEYSEKRINFNTLLQLPTNIASDITNAIGKARRVDDIVAICKQTPGLVQSLLKNAASSIEISRMLSAVADAATVKLVEIAILEIGLPPTEFTFIGLGSHGRESQTLYSDQDNAIIYRNDENIDNKELQQYFLLLAEKVCLGLEFVGYRKCDGGKMATNPEWCQPIHVWKKYFDNWIKYSEPKDVMEFNVFFDFRAIAGNSSLIKELRNHISMTMKKSPVFFVQFAKNALSYAPPITLFGNIVTNGGKEHPGRLDVKAPTMSIVSFARLYALKEGIFETHTLARLEGITRVGVILDSTRRNIVTAYEALLRFRLINQSIAIQNNHEMSNWIDPSQLGHIEEVILKECFKEIELLHQRIQRDFFGGNNGF